MRSGVYTDYVSSMSPLIWIVPADERAFFLEASQNLRTTLTRAFRVSSSVRDESVRREVPTGSNDVERLRRDQVNGKQWASAGKRLHSSK